MSDGKTDRVHIYKDEAGEWRWRRRAGNNQIVATSGEGYIAYGDCINAAERNNPGLAITVEGTDIEVRRLDERAPFLGEIVHYQAHGSADGTYPPACRAASITEVGQWVTTDTNQTGAGERLLLQAWQDNAVALHVTNPTGVFLNGGIVRDARADGVRRGGTWHYPAECKPGAGE